MQTNTKDQVYAGFFVRLTAFLIDMIIVSVALAVIRVPMWFVSLNNPDNVLVRNFIFQYSIVDIVCYLLTVLYFVLMTYYTGATLGKKLFQLRVVSTEDRKMTFFEVLYRESIGRFLSGVIMNLGYLLILAQKEHRGIHDLLADTSVIYYHEKKVYVHTQMNYRNMVPQPGYTVPPQGMRIHRHRRMQTATACHHRVMRIHRWHRRQTACHRRAKRICRRRCHRRQRFSRKTIRQIFKVIE